MKKKQLISLFLVAVMLVSMLAGCGQKEQKESKESSSSKVTETSQATEESKSTEKEEPKGPPTKLTFGSTYAMQSEPIPWYETAVYKKILEEANVEIEYIQYDKDQFNLLLASGELPDVVYSNTKQTADIIEAGLALDMAPLMEEYAPNMLREEYVKRNELMKLLYSGGNDAVYFTSSYVNTTGAATSVELSDGYNIRWDYYLEIGAPEIKDDASFIEAIEKMVAAHPTNEKGEKTYGIGIFDNFGYWTMRGQFTKQASTTKSGIDSTLYVSDLVTQELVNGYTDTERAGFWIDVKLFNELYKRGLVDPDCFTMTAEEYSAKLAAGRYVACLYNDKTLYNAKKTDNPDTLAGYVNIPSEGATINSGGLSLLGNFPAYALFINSKSKNWEAAMRLMNVLHDPDTQRMIWSGIEGETWNYVNGVPTLTEEAVAMIASGDEKLKEHGILTSKVGFGMLQNVSLHPDGYPVYLGMADDIKAATLSPILKSQAEHYGVDYPIQAALALVEAGKTIDKRESQQSLIFGNVEDPSSDYERIAQKCKDILYKAIPELVQAPTDAEFEKVQARVLKDIADTGEAEMWNWYVEKVGESAKEIMSIIGE